MTSTMVFLSLSGFYLILVLRHARAWVSWTILGLFLAGALVMMVADVYLEVLQDQREDTTPAGMERQAAPEEQETLNGPSCPPPMHGST